MPSDTLRYLTDSVASAWAAPFRGEIWENASQKLDLQGGYAVKGRFDINTARWLVEPLQAIRDPAIRLVSVQGAVQTLKSLIADLTVPYWIEHDPGDILWLFEDDPKAKLYAETRAMPLIHSVPSIAGLLEGVDRHEKTKTKIRFRHMNLVLAGLNLGNVQSLSYRYVIVDEAWLHPFDGLIRQAKERVRQYPHTSKVILLGQGGIEDDDHDTEHRQTDCRELNYRCPVCGFAQPFDLSRRRLETFHVEQLRDTYSGLSWETSEATKPKGRWNYEAVGKTAHHRCFQCDCRIEDRPDVRRALMDSYHYVPTNTAASAGAVGYHWPAEASPRIPFAELVVKYLRAKTVAEEQGYRLPLKEFFQKDRGVSWSEATGAEYRAIVQEHYEPNAAWPEEAYRVLLVDCQRDLAKFYFSGFAVSLSGEARELKRGTLDSFASIAATQKELKVKDQHVYLDCGYRMTDVLRECVRHGHVGSVKMPGGRTAKIWLCWTGMKGSGQEFFYHVHPKTLIKEARIYSIRKFYDTNVGAGQRQPRAPWYEWSNLHCKDLLRSRRDAEAGVPKFLTLPDDLPPTDQNSHFAQMRSEKRVEEYRNGRKLSVWVPVKESRPNHYWDCAGMLIAFMGIVGIIGAPEALDSAPQEADKSDQ